MEALLGASNIEGPIVTADRTKGNRNPAQIISGGQIVEVGSRKVRISSEHNRQRTGIQTRGASRRRSMQTETPVVPTAFHRGGYLVERRLTVERGQGTGKWTVRVEKPRKSPGGQYRWHETQALQFNPRTQTPVCIPGIPCSNAEFACESQALGAGLGTAAAVNGVAAAIAGTGPVGWAVIAVAGASVAGYNAYKCAKASSKQKPTK